MSTPTTTTAMAQSKAELPITSYVLDVTTGSPQLVPVLADGTVLWAIPLPAGHPNGRRLIGVTSQQGLEHAETWLDLHSEWLDQLERPSPCRPELTLDVR